MLAAVTHEIKVQVHFRCQVHLQSLQNDRVSLHCGAFSHSEQDLCGQILNIFHRLAEFISVDDADRDNQFGESFKPIVLVWIEFLEFF